MRVRSSFRVSILMPFEKCQFLPGLHFNTFGKALTKYVFRVKSSLVKKAIASIVWPKSKSAD